MSRELRKTILLCLNGGLIYCWIEFFWRGWTHWSMLILAVIMTFLLDQINEHLNRDTPIWVKAALGGAMITAIEMLAGLILNVWLKFGVWNYSNLPWNLRGQICIQYSVLWVLLAGLAIVLFDFLRWLLFGQKMPRYAFWFKRSNGRALSSKN